MKIAISIKEWMLWSAIMAFVTYGVVLIVGVGLSRFVTHNSLPESCFRVLWDAPWSLRLFLFVLFLVGNVVVLKSIHGYVSLLGINQSSINLAITFCLSPLVWSVFVFSSLYTFFSFLAPTPPGMGSATDRAGYVFILLVALFIAFISVGLFYSNKIKNP